MIDGRNLIFVAGAPRSGTTYLQRLLAALPRIKTGQESHLFSLIGPLMRGWQAQARGLSSDPRGGVGLPCYFDEKEFGNIVQTFIYQLVNHMVGSLQDGEYFVEKTPRNALYIDLINEFFPQAHIINIIRDARDVVASLLAASRSWGKNWAPKQADEAARMWCQRVNKAGSASRKLPTTQFMQVKYENLIQSPTKSLEKIINFLGIDATEGEIENAVAQNSLEIARKTGGTPIVKGGLAAKYSGQIVKEPDGFVRKGKLSGWKKDLSFFEKIQIWRVARATMKKYGYEWKYPW